MTHPEIRQGLDETKISEALTNLEVRIASLENYLGLAPAGEVTQLAGPASGQAPASASKPSEYGQGSVEMKIGEFGLAWVGSIIFFLGIVFLVTYTFSLGYPILASILGYAASAGLSYLAQIWSKDTPHLSRITVNSSLLLLFYTTMRLHFFSAEPLIGYLYPAFSLLLIVVGLQLYLALRRQSQGLATLAIVSALVSALLIDKTHIGLPLVVVVCALGVFLEIRYGWWRLLMATTILAYSTHLLWLLNNPLAGHTLRGVTEHQYNLGYLFLYAAIFTLPALLRKEADSETALSISIAEILLNCLGFSLLAFLAVMTHFPERYAAVYLGVAGLFLLISIIQWLKTHRQLAPAIYACFGFMALSIAIYGYAAIPTSFLWLSLQSLLVVSMALWFRSRFLVVVNSLIFIGILLAYLTTAPSSNLVNFSFVIVAHASARIINWQKERLTLRTESLRNVYLFIAFAMILYALYQIVPGQYVTLSWTAVAIGYFSFSYLLQNIKYRFMAMGVMLVTVVYLFLVDLARLAPKYRVAAFLFLGLMALVVSLFYTRIRRLIGKGEN